MNTIGFYENNGTYPVMVARYSQPIQMRDDTDLTIIIKYDT